MKSKFTKIIIAMIIVVMMVMTTIPFVSAAAALDTTKKVSITLSCAKPGYTFEVYKVANLTTTSTSPYEVKYTSLVPAISSSVLSGSTATILKNLDALDTIPSTAPSQGTWTTSDASASKVYNNLSQGIYYIKAINYPAGVTSVTNSVVALPYYNNSNWVYASGTINLASKVVDDTPTTNKKITNSTKSNVNFTDVSLGDTVDFEIRSTTAGSSKMHLGSYTVYDNMSAGLTLDQTNYSGTYLWFQGRWIEVITETVRQYTGFADKNGTKIFDGDIISFFNGEDNTNYEISWNNNQYVVSNNDDEKDVLDDFVCENSIVIGNIYDNPELLEVSE